MKTLYAAAIVASCAGFAACDASSQQAINTALSPASITITIDPSHAYGSLTPAFKGIAIESIYVPRLVFSTSDTDMVGLYKGLGPGGVVRVGGSDGDEIIWDNDGPGLNVKYMTPTDIARLSAFVKAVDWSVIWSVNLKTGTPAAAAQEAAVARNTFGSSLLAIEIGNEPDGYGISYEQYLAKYNPYLNAVLDAVPDAPIAGPDLADSWRTWGIPFLNDTKGKLQLFDEHYYAGKDQSDNTANGGSPYYKQFRPDSFLLDEVAFLNQQVNQTFHVPGGYRIDESNTFYAPDSAYPDQNNAFGSALWMLDMLFTTGQGGASGVNFLNVAGGIVNDNHHDGVTNIGAQYYAMRLFSTIAPGKFCAATPSSAPALFSNYAVSSDDGSLSAVLVNKNTTAVDVQVEAPITLAQATSLLLTAPSSVATDDITLGGQPIAIDGQWNGASSPLTGAVQSGDTAIVPVHVPAMSAVLVHLLPSTGKPSPPDGVTSTIALAGGLCFDDPHRTRAPGTYLQAHPCNGTVAQSFKFLATGPGLYRITNVASGNCLDANTNGELAQDSCSAASSQSWAIRASVNGRYEVRNTADGGCLSIPEPVEVDAHVEVAQCGAAAALQSFTITNPPAI